MDSGDPNSGPHSCAANSLFTRPLPQPEEETFTHLKNGPSFDMQRNEEIASNYRKESVE